MSQGIVAFRFGILEAGSVRAPTQEEANAHDVIIAVDWDTLGVSTGGAGPGLVAVVAGPSQASRSLWERLTNDERGRIQAAVLERGPGLYYMDIDRAAAAESYKAWVIDVETFDALKGLRLSFL